MLDVNPRLSCDILKGSLGTACQVAETRSSHTTANDGQTAKALYEENEESSEKRGWIDAMR